MLITMLINFVPCNQESIYLHYFFVEVLIANNPNRLLRGGPSLTLCLQHKHARLQHFKSICFLF